MEQLPCFVYQPGVHFTLPPELRYEPQTLCEFAILDDAGFIHPSPQVFREVFYPEDAAFYLFPFDIGTYSDKRLLAIFNEILINLPYYSGKERRHIVCDGGDNPRCLEFPLCLFKLSLPLHFKDSAIATWYHIPQHVLMDFPDFYWELIKYDVSFVGNLSNDIRKLACLSIKRHKELRSKIDFDDRFTSHTSSGVRYFSFSERDQKHMEKRRVLYRQSIKNSLMVLCPPGIGPQSIRMYETMYLGRIPILFDVGIVYPFSNFIDYDSITMTIPKEHILQSGVLIYNYLKSIPLDELHEKCLLTCKIWNMWFTEEKRLELMLKSALDKWPDASS
ncbi:MAG: glycosyltransferase family 47 protein [Desulfovibrio sp.]|jgi:hypothetical protein|nr:glycosyltransferase family 47 protein [Desulfovibrio sp.]